MVQVVDIVFNKPFKNVVDQKFWNDQQATLHDALPTPLGTQMRIQTKNNERVRS